MKLGFTGTREGMSEAQKYKFSEELTKLQPTEFHHGDCLGADADAHDIVRDLFPQCKIVIHPPAKSDIQAHKKGDVVLPKGEYLTRNKDIVDDTEALIATPNEEAMIVRSGTWSTVRYGMKKGKSVTVILPSGNIMV